jgi:hypothetical protein
VVATRSVGLERHRGAPDQNGPPPIPTDPTAPTLDPCNNATRGRSRPNCLRAPTPSREGTAHSFR